MSPEGSQTAQPPPCFHLRCRACRPSPRSFLPVVAAPRSLVCHRPGGLYTTPFSLWGLVVAAARSPLPAQCQLPGSPPSLSPAPDLSLWQHKCVTDSGDLVVTPRRDAGLQAGTGSVAFGHLSRTWSQRPVRGQGCPAALLSITHNPWRAGQLCPVIRGAVLKRLLSVTLVITPVQSFFMFSFNYFSLSSLTLLFPP